MGFYADKMIKLLTRRTIRGKVNILIDMLFHRKGRAGYIVDEALHTLNEGKFSWHKFRKYGNAKRIFRIRKRKSRWF